MTAHPCEPLTAVTVPPAPIKAKILGRTSVTVRRVFWYATRAKSTSPPGGKLWSGAAFTPAEDCCSVCFRQGCVIAAGGRGSEAVALRHPVKPVANGLCGGWVGINGNQL